MQVKMGMHLGLIQLTKNAFGAKIFFPPNTKLCMCPEMTEMACNVLDLQCVPFLLRFH